MLQARRQIEEASQQQDAQTNELFKRQQEIERLTEIAARLEDGFRHEIVQARSEVEQAQSQARQARQEADDIAMLLETARRDLDANRRLLEQPRQNAEMAAQPMDQDNLYQ